MRARTEQVRAEPEERKKGLVVRIERVEAWLSNKHPEWSEGEVHDEAISRLIDKTIEKLDPTNDELQAALAKYGVDTIDDIYCVPFFFLDDLDARLGERWFTTAVNPDV
jgi:hypothetical protein